MEHGDEREPLVRIPQFMVDLLMGKPGYDHLRVHEKPNIYPVEMLDYLPDPEWLIQYMVPKGDQVLVAADAGAGKTSLLFEWAWFLAEGRDRWHEWELFGNDDDVLYLVTEGFTQPKGISAGIKRRYGGEYPERLKVHVDDLRVPTDPEGWFDYFRAQPHQLVVVDTLNRTYGGEDENSSADMSRYIQWWSELAKVHYEAHNRRFTLILVHHVAKGSGKARGSSALTASVDVVMGMERDEGSPVTSVKCQKLKTAPHFRPWQFNLDWDGEGDDRYHPVVGTVTVDGPGNSNAHNESQSSRFEAERRNNILSYLAGVDRAKTTEVYSNVSGKSELIAKTLNDMVDDGLITFEQVGPAKVWSLT